MTQTRTSPLRDVVSAHVRGGSSIGGAFKFHWWELVLSCGHTVERRIRWKPERNARRGWAALNHGVPLSRLPDAPKRVRCGECGPS